jgi:hypothetical protein
LGSGHGEWSGTDFLSSLFNNAVSVKTVTSMAELLINLEQVVE